MKLKYFILILVLFFISEAQAGIRPSFSLDYCSWDATHIVIATEDGEIDGKLKILEPIKGDLGFGEVISIPQLADLKEKSSRQIHEDWYSDVKPPEKYVSGTRMVLFLKKNPESQHIWESANLYLIPDSESGNVKYSVMWIEDEKLFAFAQVVNPGPSVLVSFQKNESEIKSEIYQSIQFRNSFDLAFESKNSKELFERLRPFFISDKFFIRLSAFKELESRGKSSIPVLKSVLNDNSLLVAHDLAVETWANIGDKNLGKELITLLEIETDFWKQVSVSIVKDWRKGISNAETEIFSRHNSKTLRIVYQLRLLKFKSAENAVIKLRNLWHSSPKFKNENSVSQIVEDCDVFLKIISEKSS